MRSSAIRRFWESLQEPQTLQKFIDYVLHGLDFVCVDVDDILVVSRPMEEHINHLKIIFKRFEIL